MLRKFGAALAIVFVAQAAQATEHTVLIMGDGYFPQTTYASPGDTVRFVNMTEETRTAKATDDSWTTGPLGEGEESILAANAGLNGGYVNVANPEFTGAVRFETAPIN